MVAAIVEAAVAAVHVYNALLVVIDFLLRAADSVLRANTSVAVCVIGNQSTANYQQYAAAAPAACITAAAEFLPFDNGNSGMTGVD